MMRGLLADADSRGAHRRKVQDFRRDKPVVDDDVGILQAPQRLDRQEIGISGSGANEKNSPLCHEFATRLTL